MNKFSMGNAFNEAKAFVMQNPLLYFGLLVVAQILSWVVIALPIGGMAGFESLAASGSDPEAMSQIMAGFGGLFFICLIAGTAISLAGNYAVWRHGLANGTISAGEALVYGLKACFPALLFVFVAYIALFIGITLIALIFAGLGVASGGSGAIGALAFVLVVLVFAGFVYLLARLSIMGPIMADQNSLNPFAAAGQSWRATAGNGWMIALFFVLCCIIFIIVYMLAAMLAGGIGGASGSTGFTLILMLVLMLPVLVAGVLFAVGLPAGIYRDLVGTANKADIFN